MSDKQHPYSGGWWEDQSDESLREIKRGSFLGSRAHDGAVAEQERRARLSRESRDRRIAFWGMIAAVIAAVASVAGLFIRAS
jgi:hypothetical protein